VGINEMGESWRRMRISDLDLQWLMMITAPLEAADWSVLNDCPLKN
jgi:hypothetical protein